MPTVEEFRDFFVNEYEAAASEIEATETHPRTHPAARRRARLPTG